MNKKIDRFLITFSVLMFSASAYLFHKGNEAAAITGAGIATSAIITLRKNEEDTTEDDIAWALHDREKSLYLKEQQLIDKEFALFEEKQIHILENNDLKIEVALLKQEIIFNERIGAQDMLINRLMQENESIKAVEEEKRDKRNKALIESSSNVVEINSQLFEKIDIDEEFNEGEIS